MSNLGVRQNPFLYDTSIKQFKKTNTVTNSIKPNSLERTVMRDTISFSSGQKEKSELRKEFDEVKSQQGGIGKAWDFVKNVFGSKSGSNKVEQLIKQAEKGEISQEEAKQAIENYKEGQKTCVDVVADMASGILAVGAFALAVPTGGASLAVGLGMATAVGAGVKTGIKVWDAKATGKEYNGKDLLYDVATGGINGLLAPVTNGLGNTVTKTIGQKLGLKIVKEGAEEVAEQAVKQGFKQAAKSAVLNQTLDVAGGTVGKRAVALGAGMALDGALGGASDNMVRAALNGDNIIKAGVEGAIGGMIMAPVIGGGFRVAGKAGKALNNKITTSIVLPDGLKTKFAQGKIGDCALLSTIDGMMNNPQTAKNIKKSITKTIGGDYNVKIGDQVVRVAKSSLSDEMLSDTTGIRVFEQAYKQLVDDIDGGFAEVVAKQFGLNPVHIAKESITDELLDKLAKNQGDTVLSFGALVDEVGQISEAGQRHYFTIKNIDPETKMVTLTIPVDTSVEIPMSYEKIKTMGLSIDGGTTKPMDLPNTQRTNYDRKFYQGNPETKNGEYIPFYSEKTGSKVLPQKKQAQDSYKIMKKSHGWKDDIVSSDTLHITNLTADDLNRISQETRDLIPQLRSLDLAKNKIFNMNDPNTALRNIAFIRDSLGDSEQAKKIIKAICANMPESTENMLFKFTDMISFAKQIENLETLYDFFFNREFIDQLNEKILRSNIDTSELPLFSVLGENGTTRINPKHFDIICALINTDHKTPDILDLSIEQILDYSDRISHSLYYDGVVDDTTRGITQIAGCHNKAFYDTLESILDEIPIGESCDISDVIRRHTKSSSITPQNVSAERIVQNGIVITKLTNNGKNVYYVRNNQGNLVYYALNSSGQYSAINPNELSKSVCDADDLKIVLGTYLKRLIPQIGGTSPQKTIVIYKGQKYYFPVREGSNIFSTCFPITDAYYHFHETTGENLITAAMFNLD